MEMNVEKLIEFIVEERNNKSKDERHTSRFTSGFVSACNIILDFVHDASKQEEVAQ